jgi:hypothetical protein
MTVMRRSFPLLALLGALAACGSDDPGAIPACTGPVAMTVGSGSTPKISWSPTCRVATLSVDPNSDFTVVWVLRTAGDTNGITPPIDYGASPNGVMTLFGPGPLQAGTTYRVRILRATGDTTLPFDVIGGTYFTP